MRMYRRYGEATAADVGSGVGTAIGAGLSTFFPGLSTTGNQPTYYTGGGLQAGYVQPSWWSEQTTGTKILVGGVVFLIGAAGLVALRSKLRR